ncbi:T9SS type A sorting domain-containing protein [candidate division KSB1 bacterium]|nr:T9SS type A sorting domain-containing protein [candidate division KSB1 bacterium]
MRSLLYLGRHSAFSVSSSKDVLGTATVENSELQLPTVFALEQNYPNPFNPRTQIRYSIPAESFVRLDVFNVDGQKAAILVDQKQHSGLYSVEFHGENLASGIYLYRLDAGDKHQVKRMLLLK